MPAKPAIHLWMILLFLPAVLLPGALAAEENFYLYDAMEIELLVSGSYSLSGNGDHAEVQKATAELFLYPETDFRQQIVEFNTPGEVHNGGVIFEWEEPDLERYDFGYTSFVSTRNKRLPVRTKIPFPLSDEMVQGWEQYLLPTETIDSDNPAIVQQATSLVEGEDDLFGAAFALASWVEENVQYDLSTLTAETSQPASWVLQYKQGVCDEMTSLFVAMARAVGIPARFVSGISYSSSDLFDYPWQPHGWGEVYFPGVGWVSFDITFGEYGYIDVTHIKLRDGFDPQEPATRYTWLANNVQLEAQELEVRAAISRRGKLIPDEIHLTAEPMAEDVGLGSFNLIKAAVRNNADYYTATTLQLALPKELEVQGRNKRTLLLSPEEERETYWILQVPELDENYLYTFPFSLYSEKNVSMQGQFTARKGGLMYSEEEIGKLTVQDEEKTYSREISLYCTLPEAVKLDDELEISCRVRNRGNANIQGLKFCLDGNCDTIIDLPINQEHEGSIRLTAAEPGWQQLTVTAENRLIEKRESFPYLVADDPALELNILSSESIPFGTPLELAVTINKTSFSVPLNLTLKVEGMRNIASWEIHPLDRDYLIQATLDSSSAGAKNMIVAEVEWKDAEGNIFSAREEKEVAVVPGTLWQRLLLWVKGVLG